jgi:L-ascorbate metabolism protein UlaG (beta-lactamase superfamily)
MRGLDVDTDRGISFLWHGAAHYQISYENTRILLDPLYTRLPGDKPHLDVTRDDLDGVDHLLLTHGHLDHSWDVPYLVAKHHPEAYAPDECLRDVKREAQRSGTELDLAKWHGLERIKGKTFAIADIDVTPYQIGTEEIDFWFIRSMFLRPWMHATPSAVPAGIKWMTHHVFGNCFAFLFRFPPRGTTLLYFGNLTEEVDEMSGVDRVDVLAIPYCPANKKWLRHSQRLIERFRPEVTLVHHFDNFLNPYTLSKYMNLGAYSSALHERCPDARLFFSKFRREVDLGEIVEARATRTG